MPGIARGAAQSIKCVRQLSAIYSMGSICALAIWCLALVSTSAADGADENNLQPLLNGLTGVRYDSDVTTLIDDAYMAKHPDLEPQLAKINRHIKFATSGTVIRYELTATDSAKLVKRYRASYDGEHMQTLDMQTGILILTDGKQFLPFFNDIDILFSPLLINIDDGKPIYPQCLPLSDLTSKLNILRTQSTTSHRFDPSLGPIVTTKSGYTYKLQWKPEFGPCAADYECINKQGITVASFKVVDAIDCKAGLYTIKLPSKVIKKIYSDDGSLVRTDTEEVEKYVIGEKLQPNDAHISPGLAATIWDKKRNVWIKIHP